MKYIIKLVLTALCAFTLFACTTTTDPKIGKADFETFKQWTKGYTDHREFNEQAQQIIKNGKTEKEVYLALKKLSDQEVDMRIQQAKALKLRHTEVIDLRDTVVASLEAFKAVEFAPLLDMEEDKQVSSAALRTIEENISKMENLTNKANILYEQLDQQFDAEKINPAPNSGIN